MKRFVLLLSLILTVSSMASAQHRAGHSNSRDRGRHRTEMHQQQHGRHDNGHHHQIAHHGRPMHHDGGMHGHRDVMHCHMDGQALWNGCHVRRSLDRIGIYNRSGRRIIWADEVLLLPSGYYKVRNGDFWYIYDDAGERIFELWGDIIEVLSDVTFRCLRAGIWHTYDLIGGEIW